jgi:tetratricopeptide (TPR) repeat protein
MKKFLASYMLLSFAGGVTFISSAALAQSEPPAMNAALAAAITELQSGWDHAQYQIADKDSQGKSFEALEVKADAMVRSYPQSADVKIWDGIIYSSDAGVSGGIGALSKVKKAKALFEAAIGIDERAMNGGAHTSLGSLYYKVPSWPLGFGDNKKARKQLEAALTISPEDIDVNYFYGDFLVDQKEYAKAVPVLEKAMQSPTRVGRSIADAGRHKEIQADLDIARKELQTASGGH